MKIIDCTQGDPEWFSCRAGTPTASNFDLLVTIRGDRSKSADKYLYRLAGEKITGVPEETYQNVNMIRGQELESEARQLYQVITDNTVQEVGFCLADGGYGASPDGLVGDDGLIEIKCPTIAVHVGYLLAGTLPSDYFQQTQGQLLVMERKWVDFFSYYPGLRPLLVRVERDEGFIKKLEAELKLFVEELKVVVKKIS